MPGYTPGEPYVRATLLTPPGRGAVATIAVWGDGATAMVDPWLHAASGRPLSREPMGRIVFGRWGDNAGEELVVVRRDADSVEIHCHGGVAAPEAILHDLRESGCTQVSQDDYARAEYHDPIQLAAFLALQQATTIRTARILLDQYHGALRRELDGIAADLASRQFDTARRRIRHLLTRAEMGRHLTNPFRVVVAGPPNVGKSSLINALLGYQRAIVFDQPGTTRDVVKSLTSFDGWPIELYDTAGLRTSDDPLETAGVRLAQEQLQSADLIVLVFDLSASWSAEHERLVKACPGALIVHNKCDLIADPAVRDHGIHVSAVSGAGISPLIDEVSRRLAPNPPHTGDGVPFTREVVSQLHEWSQIAGSGVAKGVSPP